MNFSGKTEAWAVKAARTAIEYFLDTKSVLVHDMLEIPDEVKKELSVRNGLFVIIKMKDKKTAQYPIRGMMGSVHSSEELWKLLPIFSVNAAFFDYRTPRLKPYELNEISIQFLVIEELERLYMPMNEILEVLESRQPGILMEYNNRESYLLPYIWAEYPEAQQVLRILALQMGLKATMYLDTDVHYHIMNTYEFGE